MTCWHCGRPATRCYAMGVEYHACSWACARGWVIWRLVQQAKEVA